MHDLFKDIKTKDAKEIQKEKEDRDAMRKMEWGDDEIDIKI